MNQCGYWGMMSMNRADDVRDQLELGMVQVQQARSTVNDLRRRNVISEQDAIVLLDGLLGQENNLKQEMLNLRHRLMMGMAM